MTDAGNDSEIAALEWLARKADEGAKTAALDAETKRELTRLSQALAKRARMRRADAAASPDNARGIAFAEWFASLLPPGTKLAPSWREKWARVYDDLLRLDGRTEAQIAAVCQWARKHEFWRQHFLSPVKLRATRGGICFFDRFLAGMSQGRTHGMHPEQDTQTFRAL